jgi:hypothetical protein
MMFYCQSCAENKQWPTPWLFSYGSCELCGTWTDCYDVPSARLPGPARVITSPPPHQVTYLLSEDDGASWRDVAKQEFVRAERAAGFWNTTGDQAEPATAGFSGPANAKQVRGRVLYGRKAHAETGTADVPGLEGGP